MWPRRNGVKRQGKIVQASTGDVQRQPLTHPDVVTFRRDAEYLNGLDKRGNVVLFVHASDVSLAVVEDVPSEKQTPKDST